MSSGEALDAIVKSLKCLTRAGTVYGGRKQTYFGLFIWFGLHPNTPCLHDFGGIWCGCFDLPVVGPLWVSVVRGWQMGA